MSSFFRRQKDEAPEVREANTAEIAERAARLRALDDEIERRNGQLQHPREGPPTEELESASYVEPERPATPVEATEDAATRAVNGQIAGIEQVLRETVAALAVRISAVEASLQVAERETTERAHAAHEPLNEGLETRLAELEETTTTAATGLDRLSALAARVEALERPATVSEALNESLETRLAELEETTTTAATGLDRLSALAARVEALETNLQEVQRTSVEELRAEQELTREVLQQRLSDVEEATAAEATRGEDRVYTLAGRVEVLEISLNEAQHRITEQERLEARLAALEVATGEASRTQEAIEARLGDVVEGLSERLGSVDTRLAVAEHRASASDERLRAMAQSILERGPDGQERPTG